MDRCVKCIIPGTARGIKLDEKGLCQLCGNHQEFVPRGETELRGAVEPYRRAAGLNCVVPLSGGRDSSYVLYYAKRVLGLNPIAVHNDNDFETPAATRNLDAVTRRLGVPLVRKSSKQRFSKKIVAEKIKMNAPFGAALVVAQVCEACQIGFESAAYNVARANGIELILWGDSREESTASYHRLLSEPVPSSLRRMFSSQAVNLLAYKYYTHRLIGEYGPHSAHGVKNLHLYEYIRWDQDVIVSTIEKELGWTVPEGAPTSWRIDCSLVPLVNYLTERAYGVSKIELGFSSMIRYGKMAREDALRKAALIKQQMDLRQMKDCLNDMRIPEPVIDRVIEGNLPAKKNGTAAGWLGRMWG